MTGIGNWDLMAVISGLAPGDLVVLPTDVKLLADGLEVKVVVDDARLEGR